MTQGPYLTHLSLYMPGSLLALCISQLPLGHSCSIPPGLIPKGTCWSPIMVLRKQ